MLLDTPCIIFAGGKSSRMGEDKSLLPFPPYNSLTEFQFHRLSKIFKDVYISTKDITKFDFKAPFIKDVKTDGVYAPTAGFISIFEQLQSEKIFVLSVDSPFVTKEIIEKLFYEDEKRLDATIAKTAYGIQPMCGIYHRTLQNSFISMLQNNNHKLGYLLKSSNTKFVNFKDKKAFLNLNYPEEYKEALMLI